jgi:8-oxo-dGTP pyrophosphatase MutT (NUDIX family)
VSASAVQDPARVRDAASLVLVRRTGAHWRVLMGRRAERAAFMPHHWVFPGGAVDREDCRAPALSELAEGCAASLRPARRAVRAFPLAAIRETFEETGLVVGSPAALSRHPRTWTAYAAQGAAPDLRHFAYLGRALTPPGRTRRFDARFFLAEGDAVLLDDRRPQASDELVEVEWLAFDDALHQDIASVTRFMLEEAAALLEGRRPGAPPFWRFVRGKLVKDGR